MTTDLDWMETVPMLSINPDAATREQVARLASELMECRHELCRLRDVVCQEDVRIINEILGDHQ